MKPGLIRNATPGDLPGVMAIVAETVAEMQSYGNEQWNTDYPDRDRFSQDLDARSLYVAVEGSDLCGFITVDRVEPEEYAGQNWRWDQPCLVIHRFAVASARRGQGWASRLETYALGLAREAQIHYLKTDTHSTNQAMQRFLLGKGYGRTGTMRLMGRSQDFYCYDKILTVTPL
jgi:GNAT superfamily N-acetyltransferase